MDARARRNNLRAAPSFCVAGVPPAGPEKQRPLGGLALLAQSAAQDLADVGLWQLSAELDVFRTLIAGELALAMLQDILLGELRVLLHDVDLRHLAGMRIGYADDCALEDARVHGHHLLDLVRK